MTVLFYEELPSAEEIRSFVNNNEDVFPYSTSDREVRKIKERIAESITNKRKYCMEYISYEMIKYLKELGYVLDKHDTELNFYRISWE
jgi:hypothetical protein